MEDLIRQVEFAKELTPEVQAAVLRTLGYEHLDARVLGIFTDADAAIAELRMRLGPAHPGMTLKLDIRWDARGSYAFAEITWPSTERQGRSFDLCRAIIAALLRSMEG